MFLIAIRMGNSDKMRAPLHVASGIVTITIQHEKNSEHAGLPERVVCSDERNKRSVLAGVT